MWPWPEITSLRKCSYLFDLIPLAGKYSVTASRALIQILDAIRRLDSGIRNSEMDLEASNEL